MVPMHNALVLRNMKYMQLPSVAIFFFDDLFIQGRVGGGGGYHGSFATS